MMSEKVGEEVLVVFCRAPVAGACKTRLQPELSEAEALAAHVELACGTLARLADCASARVLYASEDNLQARQWAERYGYAFALQRGADLGARMDHAIQERLNQGASKVCLVGTDCPLIDGTYITHAFRALEQAEVALGPAEDGGYGLIAMRERYGALFNGVKWGSDAVLAQTLELASRYNVQVSLLPTIWDVDNFADWQRFQSWRGAKTLPGTTTG